LVGPTEPTRDTIEVRRNFSHDSVVIILWVQKSVELLYERTSVRDARWKESKSPSRVGARVRVGVRARFRVRAGVRVRAGGVRGGDLQTLENE
jgi:hypothetical protein